MKHTSLNVWRFWLNRCWLVTCLVILNQLLACHSQSNQYYERVYKKPVDVNAATYVLAGNEMKCSLRCMMNPKCVSFFCDTSKPIMCGYIEAVSWYNTAQQTPPPTMQIFRPTTMKGGRMFVLDVVDTWQTAKDLCESLNMVLASLGEPSERYVIVQYTGFIDARFNLNDQVVIDSNGNSQPFSNIETSLNPSGTVPANGSYFYMEKANFHPIPAETTVRNKNAICLKPS